MSTRLVFFVKWGNDSRFYSRNSCVTMEWKRIGVILLSKKQTVYQEVAQELLRRIQTDYYSVAQKLPSEYDLAKDFDVSRLTVRKAIDELVKMGVVMKSKGKGTYILAKQEKIQSGSFGLKGFGESVSARGMVPKTKLVLFEKQTDIDPKLFHTLQLEEKEELYLIKRVRYADDDPMVLEEIYVPVRLIPHLTKEELVSSSVFSLIEKTMEIGYSHQEIGAVAISQDVADHLDLQCGEPILQVYSTTYSLTGVPVLFDQSYYRADKYTFANTLTR